jgi:mannonate dehydratase
MEKLRRISRRHLMKLVSGGAAGATALNALRLTGGGMLASAITAIPDSVQAAQSATLKGMPRLKITDIKVILTVLNNTHMCNVKVYTSEPGLYGVGHADHAERVGIVKEYIDKYLKPAVIGRYCDEIEDIWQMAWVAPYWRGSVDASNAMSAIDSALWDIFGKRAGVPVCNFFGGKVRPQIPMFANVGGPNLEVQEENARKLIADGYKFLRVSAVGKVGRRPIDPAQANLRGQGNLAGGGGQGAPGFGERGPIYFNRMREGEYITAQIESLEHLRNAIGYNIDMLAEADAMLSPANGIVLSKALEPFRLFWLEEAFGSEDVAWHEQLRQVSATPIAVGEVFVSQHEWLPLVNRRLMDFMRMHISACGGLSHARKVAAICEFNGVKTSWHGPANVSPVGHAVNMHLDLAIQNFGLGEGAPFNQTLQEIFPGTPERHNGFTFPNDRPGLGIDIDEKVAAKFAPDFPGSDRGTRCYDGSPCKP